MKKINPLQIWLDGKTQSALFLIANSISDDLSTQATFYYALFAENVQDPNITGEKLADGNLTLSGADYLAWDGSNTFAFDWIAKQLNVTFA